MKTIDRRKIDFEQKIKQPKVVNNQDNLEIELINFQQSAENYFLQIFLKEIINENYNIFIMDFSLILVVFELKEINSRPMYIHNVDRHEVETVDYEIMKSVELWLPGKDFYIVKHFYLPEDKLLNINLRKKI